MKIRHKVFKKSLEDFVQVLRVKKLEKFSHKYWVNTWKFWRFEKTENVQKTIEKAFIIYKIWLKFWEILCANTVKFFLKNIILDSFLEDLGEWWYVHS